MKAGRQKDGSRDRDGEKGTHLDPSAFTYHATFVRFPMRLPQLVILNSSSSTTDSVRGGLTPR